MRRLTRPVAVLLTLILLQLVLVESGYACRMSADETMRGGGMAGMQMPGSEQHSASGPAQGDQQESPCRFPWAPTGCQTMAPCAPSALTVVSTAIAPFVPETNTPEQLVLLEPPALTSAPELPPPRA